MANNLDKTKPSRLLEKFSNYLFSELSDRQLFVDSILTPRRYPQGLMWLKPRPDPIPFQIENALEWQAEFIDRVEVNEHPGQNRLHEEGYYYCLDFSSVFAVSLVNTIPEQISCILDVCAAPGGKGIYLWKRFSPDLIIFNEVIGKRLGQLSSNIKRCGITNSEIISADSSAISETYIKQMDLVLVDAPCSGQSLRARGKDAYGCFDMRLIKMNARRQKRILANASRCVTYGGYLLYCTCTFSKEENEGIVEWFCEEFKEFSAVSVELFQQYRSNMTNKPCYRLYPYSAIGAGSFGVLFKRRSDVIAK